MIPGLDWPIFPIENIKIITHLGSYALFKKIYCSILKQVSI